VKAQHPKAGKPIQCLGSSSNSWLNLLRRCSQLWRKWQASEN